MPQTTRKPARVKPERTCRVSPLGESGRRILTLFAGKEGWVYWLAEVECDFGRGFALEKFTDGTVYHVHLDDALGDTCDCKGALKWGHCKHAESTRALLKAGRLP